MKSPIVLLQSLLIDFSRLSGVKGTERDLLSLSERFENEGYGFLTIALPALCDSLERGLATGQFTCPRGFKTTRGGAIPRLFSGMFREVFDIKSGKLGECPRVDMVKNLRQILRIFKKLQPDDGRLEKVDRYTKSEFSVLDGSLRDQELPDAKSHFVRCVMKQLLPGLREWNPDEFAPRHGPGVVCNGETSNQKWSAVVDDVIQDVFDLEHFGFDSFSYSMDPANLTQRDSLDRESPETRLHYYRGASRDFSRLVTVPKTFASLRTITIEPCLRQFLQQGLNSKLRDSIKECGVLKNSLDLTDQTRNQKLALEGSQTGAWATLDLKSASDLLSLKLIKLLFGGYPDFYRALIQSRSEEVRYGSTVVDLLKYAGMGNATTFPLQSVAFAVIAIAAICYEDGRLPSRRRLVACSRLVRVFGDDIIVPTNQVHHVIAWLEEFGLVVNTTKSFTTGNFRESCGVDAFKGVNVTPIYVRVRPDDASKEAKSVANLVSASNQAWLECLYTFATTLANEVEERLGRRLPLTRPECEGLGWHTRREAWEAHEWSPTLHRPEVYTYVIRPRKRKDELDGWPALLKFFLTPLLSRGIRHLKESPERFKARIVWKRVAA